MTTWSQTTRTLPGASYLLMESGDYLLLETGDKIILDQSQIWTQTTRQGTPSYTNVTKN